MARAMLLPTRRQGLIYLVPLLIVPFIAYNIMAFTAYAGQPAAWARTVIAIPMMSHAQWTVSAGEVMMALGLVCLFFEVLKSTRTGSASIVEHSLSTALLVLFLVEFLLVGAAGTSTFFLIGLMSLIDVVAGFSVSISAAERDVSYN